LEKIVSLSYYEIDFIVNKIVNKRFFLFENIFEKEKIDSIREEYFKFAKKTLTDRRKEIDENTAFLIEENNKKILERKEIKDFLDSGYTYKP
jgi:hypothetical protein